MKTLALIMLTLFSFLHEERYEANDYKCENNEIKIEYEDTWYDINLFNLFIKEDANVCAYLEGDVTFEFDSYVKIENPLNVYLFVDGELLQQTLIDNNDASIKIENPKYKYKLQEKDVKVMNEVNEDDENKETFTMSKKIAIAIIVVWVLLVVILLCLRVKRNGLCKVKRNDQEN